MTRAYNQLAVGRSVYTLNKAHREGAEAFRSGMPRTCNPHRVGTRAHYDWDAGYAQDAAGEHFRYGKDMLKEPRRAVLFMPDPHVPRDANRDVQHEWADKERARLLKATQH